MLLPLLGGVIGCAPATPPGNIPGSLAAGPAPRRSGEELYNGNCAACHQTAGQGIPGIYPRLAGSPTVLGDPGALARWVIKGQRAATMEAGRYSTAMPKFGWLEPVDAAALFTYLRTHFGNRAPPVDAATVSGALAD